MHPLASAPHSFKELTIHIGIVTVGIIIALSLEALSLEGIRAPSTIIISSATPAKHSVSKLNLT